MLINKRAPSSSFILRSNNKILSEVCTVKYLGVYIDNKLIWTEQIKELEKKYLEHAA